ncbi:MAG: histidine phosphatase family protein [Massilia sp.]
MSTRRRLFLMRHGSVTYFDEAGRPYPADGMALNAEGRAQACAAGQSFAAQQLRFDRVITSGLPRTLETAALVLAETGQQHVAESWPELAEIRGGRLADIADADLHAAFTGVFAGAVGDEQRFLGGESVGELMDRVHPALARLRADPAWDTALLVLHEGVNCAILSLALTGRRQFLGGLAQAAGCINALDVGAGESDWVVRFVNYAPSAPLHDATRGTTMEQLYGQYRRARPA